MSIDLQQLVGDPLYQVNVTLWMLQPQPQGHVQVKAILRDAGFKLRFIEPLLPLPPDLLARLQRDSLAVSGSPPSPDLLLDGSEKTAVLWECKRNTFGKQPDKDDRPQRQARSFLLHTPPVLVSALAASPASLRNTQVVYLTCLAPAHDQSEGLQHVHAELTAKGYTVSPFSVLALSADKTRVLLRQVGTASTPVRGLEGLASNPAIIQESPDPDTDPRPLYYLPWMPESEPEPSDYNQRAFADRVLAAVTKVIGLTRLPGEARILFDDALAAATHGHFRLWRNKNTKAAIVDAARDVIRKVLKKAVPEVQIQPVAGQPSPGLAVSLPDEKVKKRLIKGLRQWRDEQWLKQVQLQFNLDMP